MIQRTRINEPVKSSCFTTPEGTDEIYLTCETGEADSFEKALIKLRENYALALKKLGLIEETLVFCRFFLSDILNQKDTLRDSDIFGMVKNSAVSVIQQSPCTHDAIVLLAYHVRRENRPFHKSININNSDTWRMGVTVKGQHYSMIWTTNFSGTGPMDSKKQTKELFTSFAAYLQSQNVNLRDNLVRTWIFVRDIDTHYQGMVDARKKFFLSQGLTPDSRYVASTGIEGNAVNSEALVSMDSLTFGGLWEKQILPMNALGNLPLTITYGVTFERGLRIKFGDRSHLYISGTASIDKEGKIMHGGDVENQTRRTLDNIKMLLKNQGASLSDMAYLLCYVRNVKHFDCVNAILKDGLPRDIPLAIVQGAVCRPGWLVEIEGVAIIPDKNQFPPFF
jgi:enamine deaminase RidA (YjgF/YER057c/UK114 family)